MEAATAALEALTVGGGESVLPVISGSRGHSPLALGGSSPVPGAVGTSGGAVPAAAAAAPVQIAGGPVAAAGGPVAQPNPENKLFVGGAPPGTDEETLKKIFEDHGEVEEVFLMRGGSRSGQACAFVRFVTPEGAIAAIQAVHGKYIMPGCTDPLVVRYADAPGSRTKKKGQGGAYGGFGPGPYGYGYPGMGGPPGAGGWGGGPFGGPGWPGGFPGYPGAGPYGMPYPNGMGVHGMGPGMGPGMGGLGPGMGPPGMGAPGMGPGMGPAMGAAGMGAAGMGAPPQALGAMAQPQQAGYPGMGCTPSGGGGAAAQPTPTVISGRPVEGAPEWSAYTAPDGRTYYYNAKTGVSSWEKPGPAAPQAALLGGGAFGY